MRLEPFDGLSSPHMQPSGADEQLKGCTGLTRLGRVVNADCASGHRGLLRKLNCQTHT
jgi:hypothetical protein